MHRIILALRSAGGRGYMRAANALFGIQSTKVVFSSFAGNAYSDSPRAISEQLHRMRPDAQIVWHLSRRAKGLDEVPDYVRIARARSPRILFHYATARVIVDNFNRPWYLKKYAGQAYIQTWHGDRGFKKILFDRRDGIDYPDRKYMDLAVSGSRFGSEVYRSAFRYEGRILECGLPRNDVLLNPPPALADEVRSKLGIAPGTRVLLYAPTFRDATAGRAQAAGFEISAALERLRRRTGENWTCLVRGHVENGGVQSDAGVDVSDCAEMSHLLLISDLLVTDYSSCAGDFALLGRPVVLYQPDLEAYRTQDRELYFDMGDSPWWVARSQEELYAYFDRMDQAPENCREVLKFYGSHETGRAARMVCEYILSKMEGCEDEAEISQDG